jgi:magnesium transporter
VGEEQKQLLKEIKPILERGDISALKNALESEHSGDIAEIVEIVDDSYKSKIFNSIDKETAAEVLEKIDPATRTQVFELLGDEKIKNSFTELDLDDAADLLAEMPEETSERVLSSLDTADRVKISQLMSYPEDSAGGIMDPVLISLPENATASQAVEKIRKTEIDEDFYSIYVVDKQGKFLGDVRLRLLLTCSPGTEIGTLVDPDAIYVVADDDQERVRNVFSRYDLIVVPVLDKKHRLIGRITADRILEVAEEEAQEDIYAMAGTKPDELEKFSALHAARIRMTWLLPCLIGTGITALVLMFFENFNSLLYIPAVAFVPMIAAISGNAGLQTSAIVVSGLASGHLAAMRFSQVFSREVRIALLVALSCGITGAAICAVMIHTKSFEESFQAIRLISAFGISMSAAIMVATTLGFILPFFFRNIGIDPAISSGPLVTTANDSISVAIYMTMTFFLAA